MYIETELTSGFWVTSRFMSLLLSFLQIAIGMFLWASHKVPTVSLYTTLLGWFIPELMTLFEVIVICRYLPSEQFSPLFWGRWFIVFLTFIGAITSQILYFMFHYLDYSIAIALCCWGITSGSLFYESLASTCCLESLPQEDGEDESLLA